MLAARLKWLVPLPLLAGALLHPLLQTGGRRPHPSDASWPLGCCAAYGRAFAQASALFDQLGRSAEKLVAVTPRLRAKGAGTVLETFLNEDAVGPGSRLGARDVLFVRTNWVALQVESQKRIKSACLQISYCLIRSSSSL